MVWCGVVVVVCSICLFVCLFVCLKRFCWWWVVMFTVLFVCGDFSLWCLLLIGVLFM